MSVAMFNFLKRKYDENKIGEIELNEAVARKWISEQEKEKIISK